MSNHVLTLLSGCENVILTSQVSSNRVFNGSRWSNANKNIPTNAPLLRSTFYMDALSKFCWLGHVIRSSFARDPRQSHNYLLATRIAKTLPGVRVDNVPSKECVEKVKSTKPLDRTIKMGTSVAAVKKKIIEYVRRCKPVIFDSLFLISSILYVSVVSILCNLMSP